jgi:hypothetical protein
MIEVLLCGQPHGMVGDGPAAPMARAGDGRPWKPLELL